MRDKILEEIAWLTVRYYKEILIIGLVITIFLGGAATRLKLKTTILDILPALLTSLTTMTGFGSLIFATYKGLNSLGIVLFIGVGICFLVSVFILPPLLRIAMEGERASIGKTKISINKGRSGGF